MEMTKTQRAEEIAMAYLLGKREASTREIQEVVCAVIEDFNPTSTWYIKSLERKGVLEVARVVEPEGKIFRIGPMELGPFRLTSRNINNL